MLNFSPAEIENLGEEGYEQLRLNDPEDAVLYLDGRGWFIGWLMEDRRIPLSVGSVLSGLPDDWRDWAIDQSRKQIDKSEAMSPEASSQLKDELDEAIELVQAIAQKEE